MESSVKQYDVVLVNLDPTIGSEIKKTRPCVVLSPNEMNKYLNTIVVAPLTSSLKPYPTRIEVQSNIANGWIAIDQIRTIHRKRIIKYLDSLDKDCVAQVKSVIKETYVD
ncbi:MAG: type II toxin-antitoxin system PemK/MazF family toxin [Runella sp.]